MIEYLYFVKWLEDSNIAEEVFDFFDEAKEFALGLLSQQPEIHQTEIIRNDFGECTDSRNLGKVWSWEELMDDIPEDTEVNVFTKGDFAKYADGYNPDNDPEFDDSDITFETDCVVSEHPLDEAYYAVIEVDGKERRFPFDTRDDAREYIAYVRAGKDPVFKGKQLGSMYTESYGLADEQKLSECGKPVPADMSIDALVEAMEENEEIVECKNCHDLFPKEDCAYELSKGYLCPICIMDLDAQGVELEFKPRELPEQVADEEVLEEGLYDFEHLVSIADAKEQILELLKNDAEVPNSYIIDDKLAIPYVFINKDSYIGETAAGTIVDFNILPTGKIDLTIDYRGQISHRDLETVAKSAPKRGKTYKAVIALRTAATQVNKNNRPSRTVRNATKVFDLLNDTVAEEFKKHIKKIKYRIPLTGIYPEEFGIDSEGEYISPEAEDKLDKIYNYFISLPFANDAIDAGIVENRSSIEDTTHNIKNYWHAVGNITFDCPVSKLSPEAQNIISASKGSSLEDLTSKDGNTVSRYHLANALIQYFNNNVSFYEKEVLAASLNSEDKKSLTENKNVAKHDYEEGKDWEFTGYNDYDIEFTYYVPCSEVLEALMELVDDDYVKSQADENFPYETVKELKDAGKLKEFFMVDFGTDVHNYSDELEDYFEGYYEEAKEESNKECEDEWGDEDPDGFSGWDDFYRWKNGM